MKSSALQLNSIIRPGKPAFTRQQPEILKQAVVNNRKPKKREYTRPLNEKELTDLMILMVSAQLILDNIQRLEFTNVYKQTVKHYARHFITCLEDLTSSGMWEGQDDETNYRAHNAISEMGKITEEIIKITARAKGGIPAGQQPLFWREVNLLAEKFEMPVKFAPNGDFISK